MSGNCYETQSSADSISSAGAGAQDSRSRLALVTSLDPPNLIEGMLPSDRRRRIVRRERPVCRAISAARRYSARSIMVAHSKELRSLLRSNGLLAVVQPIQWRIDVPTGAQARSAHGALRSGYPSAMNGAVAYRPKNSGSAKRPDMAESFSVMLRHFQDRTHPAPQGIFEIFEAKRLARSTKESDKRA